MSGMQRAIGMTLSLEGGWYAGNEERDTNPTNQGVTQDTWERLSFSGSVRDMTPTQRQAIYEIYWKQSRAALLPWPASAIYFDHFFNSRPDLARKVLQRALRVADDGVLGPVTRRVIDQVAGGTPAELDLFAHRVLVERLREYKRLARSRRLRPNLYSWITRLTTIAEQWL